MLSSVHSNLSQHLDYLYKVSASFLNSGSIQVTYLYESEQTVVNRSAGDLQMRHVKRESEVHLEKFIEQSESFLSSDSTLACGHKPKHIGCAHIWLGAESVKN